MGNEIIWCRSPRKYVALHLVFRVGATLANSDGSLDGTVLGVLPCFHSFHRALLPG